MKRMMLFVLMGFSIAVLASAKDHNRRGPGPGWGWGGQQTAPQQPVGEAVTVTGNLTIVQGALAVQNNGITYYVRGLNRFIGFIDGLKDGAKVTLQGSALTNPLDDKIKFLRIAKLTINGKDYDLAPPAGVFPPGMGMGPQNSRRW